MNPQIERLEGHLGRLKLHHTRETLASVLERAAKKELSLADFLDELLTEEVSAKNDKNIRMRMNLARLPYVKTLETFDFAFQPSVDAKQVRELASGRYLDSAENVVLLGPPGVGIGMLTVWQGKGRKDRVIPVPPISLAYVKEYIEKIRPAFAKRRPGGDDGLLFINYTGAPIASSRFSEMFTRYARAAQIDKQITTMTLRHSIASHLLENGMGSRYIQEFLGHENLSSTQIYAKVTLTGLKKHYNKHHPKEKRRQRKFDAGADY